MWLMHMNKLDILYKNLFPCRSIWGRLESQVKNWVKLQKTSNDKSNSVNVLVLNKHAKVSTVTFYSTHG